MKKIILILSLLTLAGCATTSTFKAGNTDGTKITIENKTYDQVWKAALKAMSNQLTIVEKSKENGVIKAEKGVGVTTWGGSCRCIY